MATKKTNTPTESTTNTNNNKNNNVNNNTVNVNINHPTHPPSGHNNNPAKPNWVWKAIVLGIIGLILSLAGYFIKKTMDGGHGSTPGALKVNFSVIEKNIS